MAGRPSRTGKTGVPSATHSSWELSSLALKKGFLDSDALQSLKTEVFPDPPGKLPGMMELPFLSSNVYRLKQTVESSLRTDSS